jgi:hypothetical protein
MTLGASPLPAQNYLLYIDSNILGGSDLEDKESIRLSAPAIFQSLDRLVTRADYKYYLTSLTSPLAVKHAVVWGEAEECRSRKVGAYQNLFNVAVVSVLGSLYNQTAGNYTAKDVLMRTSAYYDADDFNSCFVTDAGYLGEQTYCELFVQGLLSDLMSYQYSNSTNPKLSAFLKKVKERSQATVKNIYIPPIIQGFKLSGTVYLKPFVDSTQTKTDVENSVRQYFDTNLDPETPVYVSTISQLINSNANVKYCDVSFIPIDVDDSYKTMGDISAALSSAFNPLSADYTNTITSAYNLFGQYLESTSASVDTTSSVTVNYGYTTPGIVTSSTRTYHSRLYSVTGINERSFYDEYATNLFNACSDAEIKDIGGLDFATSDYFNNFIQGANSSLKLATRYAMLDAYGNITNFSLPNEIPMIYDELNFVYGS